VGRHSKKDGATKRVGKEPKNATHFPRQGKGWSKAQPNDSFNTPATIGTEYKKKKKVERNFAPTGGERRVIWGCGEKRKINSGKSEKLSARNRGLDNSGTHRKAKGEKNCKIFKRERKLMTRNTKEGIRKR